MFLNWKLNLSASPSFRQKYLPTKFLKAEGGVWPAWGPGCFCFLFDIVAGNCFGLFGPFPGPFGRISCWGYWRFFFPFFPQELPSFFSPACIFVHISGNSLGENWWPTKPKYNFGSMPLKAGAAASLNHIQPPSPYSSVCPQMRLWFCLFEAVGGNILQDYVKRFVWTLWPVCETTTCSLICLFFSFVYI